MYDKSGPAVNLPASSIFYVLRLEPGDDLRNGVWTFAQEQAITGS